MRKNILAAPGAIRSTRDSRVDERAVAVRRGATILMILVAIVAAPPISAEGIGAQRKADIVISKEQLKAWLQNKETCGDIEGKRCHDEFQATLELHQKVAFDDKYEKKQREKKAEKDTTPKGE